MPTQGMVIATIITMVVVMMIGLNRNQTQITIKTITRITTKSYSKNLPI